MFANVAARTTCGTVKTERNGAKCASSHPASVAKYRVLPGFVLIGKLFGDYFFAASSE
jgi:hypothetical protein